MVEITKAPIVKEPIILKRDNDIEKYKFQFEEVIDRHPDMFKLNFFEKMSVWISDGAKYSKVVFIIINLIIKIGGVMSDKKVTTNDQKTTRTGIIQGIIGAVISILALFFTIDISAEMQQTIVGVVAGIWSIVVFVQGYFTNKPDELNDSK